MTQKPYRIDVHHHIHPQYYLDEVHRAGIQDAGGIDFSDWSPESQLAAMDRNGIAVAMNSVAAPGAYFGDPAAARRLARRLNETLAELKRDYPTRFGALATLVLPDVDGSLAELEYAYDTLGVDGVSLLTSIEGRYLGDPGFDPLLAELNRRKAVIHLHPNVPESSKVLKLDLPESMVEFVFDTTRMVASLIFSGAMERYPDLKFVLSHAGGTVPFVAGRLALFNKLPKFDAKAPQGAITYIKRFYYDTALATAPTALLSLSKLIDPSHILYGSDIPFLPEALVGPAAKELGTFAGFDSATLAAIERDNALALFPRIQAG